MHAHVLPACDGLFHAHKHGCRWQLSQSKYLPQFSSSGDGPYQINQLATCVSSPTDSCHML